MTAYLERTRRMPDLLLTYSAQRMRAYMYVHTFTYVNAIRCIATAFSHDIAMRLYKPEMRLKLII